eukprot:TRINITY_DN27480_c0_g1_i1.p1 TRINITY_DN27480_c0_g1~~TRINITY_DN27480_c0_g1_i1.p1  ORF type:complete len:1142 (-),score=202.18 TRINITY_DN27480_c0_g1_i1:10-3216(-)
MVFATEASNDKGLVHCLEHLCFMGSSKYKKGHLDFLAQRCGCEGTNAYTEADHTCFEFTAAGETGLLAVLPVFIDHILCPSLSEDAFVTEIHHLNGKGERQGVVFSEMLGRVTDEQEILDLELRKATFGNESPYSYEHGGMPDEILKLTRGEISEYHKQVYTTDNLYVFVTGNFDESKLLAVLGESLDAAAAQGVQRHCCKRPFATSLPARPSSNACRRQVHFPSDDVSVGTIAYSHCLDGVCFNDIPTITALDVLGRFLTGLASSPLEQAFVQCDPPVASSVKCDVNITADPHLVIEFTGVPFCASDSELSAAKKLGGGDDDDSEDADENETDSDNDEHEDAEDDNGRSDADDGTTSNNDDDTSKIDWFSGEVLVRRLVDELRRVHKALLDGDESTFGQLQRSLKKESVERRVEFEDEPNEFVRDSILEHLIFRHYPSATRNGSHTGVLQTLPAHAGALNSLSGKPASFWADLLSTHLLGPLVATLEGTPGGAAEVRSCPSARLCLQNERKEEKEAKANAKKLGKKKLKVLQERVDAAEEANGAGLDEQQRASFPPPALPSSAPDFAWQMALTGPPADGGLEVLEVEVASCFVELHVTWLLDSEAMTNRIGAELRPYLPLFASLLCETDIAGESYRSVVARLDDELVSHNASMECGSELLQKSSYPCQLTLKLSAEQDKVAELVAWADKLAHECEFPEERVLATARRMITGLKESMREGETVLAEVVKSAVHGPLSPQVCFGAFSQRAFLHRCVDNLAATCQALGKLRDILTSPGTAAAAIISASTAELRGAVQQRLQDAWKARHATSRRSLLEAVKWTSVSKSRPPPLLPLRHLAVGCAGTDTTTVQLRADLPMPPPALDIRKSWSLRLLCEALSMMEGPLSTAIRGKGLAYGASVCYDALANAVVLELWECTNVRKGIEASMAVLKAAAVDKAMLTRFQVDNARGSMVFALKANRATPNSVTGAAASSAARGWRSAKEVLDWEDGLALVTEADLLEAYETCLSRLCDPAQIVACVVCDPSDCKKAAKNLAGSLGLEAKQVFVKETLSDCYEMVHGRIQAALDALR